MDPRKAKSSECSLEGTPTYTAPSASELAGAFPVAGGELGAIAGLLFALGLGSGFPPA